MLRKFVKKFKITKQSFVAFLITISVLIYFSSYAIFGDKGIVKYFKLRQELRSSIQLKESLGEEIKEKESLAKGMNSNSLDVDLLDEEARKNLGHSSKNEIVIYEE